MVCSANRESVSNVRVSFKLCYQRLHKAHLCILAAPPSGSTSTCTHTHAPIKDNASLHMQSRVTIGYLASQPCQAHNESLHQWTQSLSSTLQMGVYRLPLRHHLLPIHYRPESYFHDACFLLCTCESTPTPYKQRDTAVFKTCKSPKSPRAKSDKDFNALSWGVSMCLHSGKRAISDMLLRGL